MKVLIACEESQTITLEMRKLGIEAYSCDIEPCSGGHPQYHIQGDAIQEAYSGKYDLMVAHPPCTYLTLCANRWMHPKYKDRFPNRQKQREDAIEFFLKMYNAPIERVAIENPVGVMSSSFRKPDQYVQPYYFGDPERKKTGLWLRNLPLLKPTEIVEPNIIYHKSGNTDSNWHFKTIRLPAKERTRMRSKTFQGLARAIAEQWGS